MIRKAKLSDIVRLKELAVLIDVDFEKKNDFNYLLKNELYDIYVYEIDNFVIGFVIILSLYENSEIIDIVIDKNYQHKGYGNALLEHVLDNLSENTKFINLEVRASNECAINLYKKNNFINSGVRKKYYTNGEDAIIMRKEV